ncbi:hypothetical protein LGM89_03400 [Burkholderia sp. AU31624]|uniref:hypothetical protein n=1 Tax=Burkholderia sp. AU31624 TaxID=2879629 RepID=UPI001CF4926F|nr:hypothetical protein [Burkholderia sp. AU31624]MCA8252304.1 hypothetical protein [Burkholderia sp. AU31624]
MAKKTKYLHKFLSRADHFFADIELADVFAISSASGVLSQNNDAHLFDSVDPTQHPTLARRKNNDHNRRLAVRHLKASLCSGFIKDLYEDFNEYMQDILEAAARNGINPKRLVGNHKVNIEANDLLAAGNWDSIVHMIARSIFRKLEEERNTKSLILAMDAKLDLGIDHSILNTALPYFELRHLLVHHDGIADADFCVRFPSFGASVGNKISVEFTMTSAARSAIIELAKHFDSKVMQHQLILKTECQ